MKYEIHIGERFDIEQKTTIPKQVIIITSDQLATIEEFAHIRKDSELNKIYRLNECEFKVVPRFFGTDNTDRSEREVFPGWKSMYTIGQRLYYLSRKGFYDCNVISLTAGKYGYTYHVRGMDFEVISASENDLVSCYGEACSRYPEKQVLNR